MSKAKEKLKSNLKEASKGLGFDALLKDVPRLNTASLDQPPIRKPISDKPKTPIWQKQKLDETTKLSTVDKKSTVDILSTMDKLSSVDNSDSFRNTLTPLLTNSQQIIYMHLIKKSRNLKKESTDWLGYKQLAQENKVTTKTIQRSIDALIKIGLIKKIEFINTGKRKGSKYQIFLPTEIKMSTVDKKFTVDKLYSVDKMSTVDIKS